MALYLSANHKTTQNIRKRGAFTVSFADAAHVTACDYVGMASANSEPNKMAKADFHTSKSAYVDAPLIDELPMALECKLIKFNEDGNVIGEIVNISADERILDAQGNIDCEKLAPIAFDPVQNVYRIVKDVVGKAFQDGAALK